jgi:hypothetical protein
MARIAKVLKFEVFRIISVPERRSGAARTWPPWERCTSPASLTVVAPRLNLNNRNGVLLQPV